MRPLFYLLIISLMFISCSESTSPNNDSNIVFKQTPGCNNYNLLKAVNDSCFSYTFSNSLNIYLCLPANCCPDSNRFDYSYSLDNNSINLIALDTATNLCRCVCNYLVEIRINGLSENNYTFNCTLGDSLYYYEQLIKEGY